uniref:Putative transcription factor gt-2 n=1 Tax=Corethrella appendiculata TaxID=1370023 RepID=U5EPK5_9DIPT
MWVSTNKVLIGNVGGPKRPHARNPNFDCEETKLLISLWGDPQVQKTLITTHKKHPVIAKLAEKMREYGYNRSTEEINTRIKNLKCFYNRIKKDMESGTISDTNWKHYSAMDEILTRPIFGNAHRQHMLLQQQQQQHEAELQKKLQEEQEQQNLQRLPVKLEVMSDEEASKEMPTTQSNVTSSTVTSTTTSAVATQIKSDQIEIGETGLLIPKDEPMDVTENIDIPDTFQPATDDEDDENDDDDDDEDDDSEDDEEDYDIDIDSELSKQQDVLQAALNASKNKPTTSTPTSTGGIKILNYGTQNKPNLSIASVISNTSITSTPSNIIPAKSTLVTTTTTTASGTPTTGPPSKISLVPTNFLLKPQSQNQLSFKSPIHLYTKPTVSMPVTASSTTTISTQSITSGGVGSTSMNQSSTNQSMPQMKVLLVNTLSKDNVNKQKTVTTTQQMPVSSQVRATPIHIQPKPMHTVPSPNVVNGSTATGIATVNTTMNGGPNFFNKKPNDTPGRTAGFRVLLNQLVSLQTQSLSISRQRLANERLLLEVERERLQYEKQVGNSLVNLLQNFSDKMCSNKGKEKSEDDLKMDTQKSDDTENRNEEQECDEIK